LPTLPLPVTAKHRGRLSHTSTARQQYKDMRDQWDTAFNQWLAGKGLNKASSTTKDSRKTKW